MTTLADRLDFPNLSVCYLFEVTAGERLKHWIAADGGYANTYYASTVGGASRTVEHMMENGMALTERASIALVDANAGSWYWDRTNSRVYVHSTGSVSPYTKSLQAMLQFYFTDRPGRIYNDIYYDPRVKGLPSLSMRVEEKFGATSQLGGGKLELNNQDGLFDSLSEMDWNAGTARILMGADAIQGRAQATYGVFDVIGTWRVTSWERSHDEFVLELEERKGVLKLKLPAETWTLVDWPLMEERSIGKAKAIAYGYIYDVRPVCVDVSALTFRVAGHAVHDISAVRVYDSQNDAWIIKPIATKNVADAEFTLAEGDWQTGQDIAVDLVGMENADGSVMENAADVVDDLIFTQAGEAAAYKHSASFAASKAVLALGVDRFGNPRVHLALSLYVSSETEVLKIIKDICHTVGAYLFNDFDGKYRLVAFDPAQRAGLESFSGDREINLFKENAKTTAVFSTVKVQYSYRPSEKYPQTEIIARASGQYYQQAPQAVIEVIENVPVTMKSDARYIGERFLRSEGEPHRTYRVRVNWRGWKLMPGDYIHLSLTRSNEDAVFEVLEVRRSMANRMWIDLVLGDLHGLRDEPGWWTEDAPVFPALLGGGSAAVWDKNWTPAQKAWARQNIGYWSDDNGFADSSDPDSQNTGVWI